MVWIGFKRRTVEPERGERGTEREREREREREDVREQERKKENCTIAHS